MIKEFCDKMKGKSFCDDCNDCSIGEIIKEHDKQIRAEVLDELFNTENANGKTLKEIYEEVPINEFDEGWNKCYEDFEEVVEQLKEQK